MPPCECVWSRQSVLTVLRFSPYWSFVVNRLTFWNRPSSQFFSSPTDSFIILIVSSVLAYRSFTTRRHVYRWNSEEWRQRDVYGRTQGLRQANTFVGLRRTKQVRCCRPVLRVFFFFYNFTNNVLSPGWELWEFFLSACRASAPRLRKIWYCPASIL